MSKRKKLLLLILSVAALALFALAGCMGEMGAEEFLEQQGATDQCVTYYANGGTFDKKSTKVIRTLFYKPDSYVVDDFSKVDINASVERDEYVFNGWYYVELGADGLPKTDENGNITLTDTPVDFTKKIQANEKWYIGAQWVADVRLEIKLVTSDGGKMTATNGTEYENGAILTTRTFPYGVAVMDTNAPVKSSDYTFTQFFHDEACTQRVTANIPQPEGAEENPVIYAQYLKGSWTVVRTASDVRDMINRPAGKNYWIATMTEEKVIDCSKIELALKTGEFAANIEGNGYTIKGLTVKGDNITMAGVAYSTFGQFTQKSTLKNLTFENLTINAQTAKSASVYAICSSAEGATLENLTFKGVKLNAQSITLTNIPAVDDGYKTDNWLFGGEQTDKAFLEKNVGVALNTATLTINKTEYEFGN